MIRAAAPIPVPMHIDTTPKLVLVLWSSGIRVAICLAPNERINLNNTCATKRMSQSNGSSLGIKLRRVYSQLFNAVRCLTGKCFVNLPYVDIAHLLSCLCQKIRNSYGWTNTHNLRRASFYCVSCELGQNGETKLFSDWSPCQNNGSCSISDLWTISCCSSSSFPKCRFKFP